MPKYKAKIFPLNHRWNHLIFKSFQSSFTRISIDYFEQQYMLGEDNEPKITQSMSFLNVYRDLVE